MADGLLLQLYMK